MMKTTYSQSKALTASFLSLVVTSPGAISSWSASSGLFPDQLTLPWQAFNTATPEVPTLASSLNFSTDASGEWMGYQKTDSELNMPSNLTINANLKIGSSSSPLDFLSSATIAFGLGSQVGNYLFFEEDSIFLLTNNTTRGPEATIDTNDFFHDYRIEVDGLAIGSTIQVFQDNVLLLTGATYSSPSNGATPRIFFGDPSSSATGTSEWTSLSHNAGIPEPSSLLLLSLGAGFLVRRKR